MKRPEPGDRFEVSYTAGGDSLGVQTSVLEARAVTRLGCGCYRVRFDRPGGSITEHPGTDIIDALSGCAFHKPEFTPSETP